MRCLALGLVATALCMAGCSVGLGVSFPLGGNVSLSAEKKVWSAGEIDGETVWSGEMVVKKPVTVKKGATLKILPGTKVEFDVAQVDHNAAGHHHEDAENSWVYVEGKVIAKGEPERKIIFTSAKDMSQHGDVDAFTVIASQGAEFSNVVFEKCGWSVHLHDTPGALFSSSVFRGNYGGIRFKGDGVTFDGNLFEKNHIGVRAIAAKAPAFINNEFRGNITGIFLREEVSEAKITGNKFADEEYDIKLGEEQKYDVTALGNEWKAKGRLAEVIYDGSDSEGVGRVITEETNGR